MYMNGYPAYPYGAAPQMQERLMQMEQQKYGHNLYATQIRTRRNYVLHVAAGSSTFTLVHGCLNNCNCGAVASLS